MGGMLSYHAMGKIADKIAAFAPCSGYLMMGAGTAQRPVPIFHTHGTSDNVVGYDGLENNLKSYRDQFKCPSQAEVESNHPNSENRATLYTWGPCENGIYVKHLKLEGRQHSPSKADVSDIWNFVKQWDLNGLISDKPEPESSSSEIASSSSVASSSSEGTEALALDVSLASVSVFKSSDNSIMVSNAEGKSITVFNSLGQIVRTTRGIGNVQKVYTGAKGVYIVKVGSRTFKTSL
jgi:hypothetical protein